MNQIKRKIFKEVRVNFVEDFINSIQCCKQKILQIQKWKRYAPEKNSLLKR